MNEETVITWIEDIDIVAAMISFTYHSVQKYFAKELAQHHIIKEYFVRIDSYK